MSVKTNDRGACATIYGPVKSRRHGLSLGINLGSPSDKICTWGCVYCQCGMGTRGIPTADNGAKGATEVLELLKRSLAAESALDSVTFAGNSEPSSHPEFYLIVQKIQELKTTLGAKWIFNCLSNGSELDNDQVVLACDLLDEVWIKLDCVSEDLFRRLNRPVGAVGTGADHIQRISRLKNPFIQTLLWGHSSDASLGNFSDENRRLLLKAYQQIRPGRIHLTTVSRDTAVAGISPISEKDLNGFALEIEQLGLRVEVFA